MSPALAGGFLTTVPPGKSGGSHLYQHLPSSPPPPHQHYDYDYDYDYEGSTSFSGLFSIGRAQVGKTTG